VSTLLTYILICEVSHSLWLPQVLFFPPLQLQFPRSFSRAFNLSLSICLRFSRVPSYVNHGFTLGVMVPKYIHVSYVCIFNCFVYVFFSPVPCDPYYKLLPVFHAFPPTLIHPFVPLTSSRDFLPLSYAFTLGSQSISSSITLCVRGFVSCNFFVHAMGFPCVPVFQVAIVDPHHNGHIGDRGNWPL